MIIRLGHNSISIRLYEEKLRIAYFKLFADIAERFSRALVQRASSAKFVAAGQAKREARLSCAQALTERNSNPAETDLRHPGGLVCMRQTSIKLLWRDNVPEAVSFPRYFGAARLT